MSLPLIRQGYYPSDDDYYVILDVDFNASQEEISSAYKNLARRYHPDKNNQDERSRREAEHIFGKIKTAYDVLGDPRKRQIYDTLGADGVKADGWQIAPKRMTAQEIRDEFMRLQQQQLDNKLAIVAKPRASITLSIDASDIFAKTKINPSDFDDDQLNNNSDDTNDWDDDDDLDEDSLYDSLPSIELSSMSASMAVDNNIAANHSMTLSGNVNTKNGTGDCSFGTNYRYKYSPATKLDLFYQFGNGPMLTAGISHQINPKTNVSARGFLVIDRFVLIPGCKFTLSHQIRNNVVGRVSYKEGINPNVSTSLIYINQRLLLEVTTTYKLARLYQAVSIEIGHRFNNNQSKVSVSLGANTRTGVAVEYGCETRVLDINVIGASVAFSTPSGVTLKLRFNRANQEFVIPIYLSDEIQSAPIFYGTMVPLIAFYLLDNFYLKQYKKLR